MVDKTALIRLPFSDCIISLRHYLLKLNGSSIHFDKSVWIPNILVSYPDDEGDSDGNMLVNE
jgi:hypothetical protein